MFQKLYDILMEDIDYKKIYDLIKPYINNTDLIIDAGCGSGYFLLELLNNQHYAIGIDNDTKMLSLAKDKLQNYHYEPLLFEHDLRKPFKNKADVIIMIFDVVNYFKGIKNVFYNVYQALDNNGRFIFDVYKLDMLDFYKDFYEEDHEIISYVWKTKTYKNIIYHEVISNDQVDKVKQYIYPLHYYLDILKEIGFKYQILESVDVRKHLVVSYK